MKRVAQLVMVAGLALGAQSAWSGEGHVPYENDPRDTPAYFESIARTADASLEGVAGRPAEEAQPKQQRANVLEEMGLAGHGPFPSRGGPIDGGGD